MNGVNSFDIDDFGYFSRLRNYQTEAKRWLCIGLDPTPKLIERLFSSYNLGSVLHFNAQIVEATKELCCAIKLNPKFYSSLDDSDDVIVKTFQTIKRINPRIQTILDYKACDIDETLEQ